MSDKYYELYQQCLYEKEELEKQLAERQVEVEEWQKKAEIACAEVDNKQAKIDALIFEYCPDEMTDE